MVLATSGAHITVAHKYPNNHNTRLKSRRVRLCNNRVHSLYRRSHYYFPCTLFLYGHHNSVALYVYSIYVLFRRVWLAKENVSYTYYIIRARVRINLNNIKLKSIKNILSDRFVKRVRHAISFRVVFFSIITPIIDFFFFLLFIVFVLLSPTPPPPPLCACFSGLT